MKMTPHQAFVTDEGHYWSKPEAWACNNSISLPMFYTTLFKEILPMDNTCTLSRDNGYIRCKNQSADQFLNKTFLLPG